MPNPLVRLSTVLDQQLKAAGIPIVSVSIGREQDRATWTVEYAASATALQRTAGAALLAAFNLGTLATQISEASLDVSLDGLDAIRTTVVFVLMQKLGRQPTQLEVDAARTQWKAIYRTLTA